VEQGLPPSGFMVMHIPYVIMRDPFMTRFARRDEGGGLTGSRRQLHGVGLRFGGRRGEGGGGNSRNLESRKQRGEGLRGGRGGNYEL